MKSQPAYSPVIVMPTVTPPEQLEELRKAGYVPVCCDSPEKVVVILPQSRLAGDDLLMSALHGLCRSSITSTEKSYMVDELNRRLLKNESPKAK